MLPAHTRAEHIVYIVERGRRSDLFGGPGGLRFMSITRIDIDAIAIGKFPVDLGKIQILMERLRCRTILRGYTR